MDRKHMLRVLYKNRCDIIKFLANLEFPERTEIKRAIMHERAKELRSKLTPSEKIFKDILLKAGERPIKLQMELQFMIIDFALPSRKLLIEVDGPYHNQAWKKDHDSKRDAYVKGLGFNILRMTNEQAEDREYVLNTINQCPTNEDNIKLFNFLVLRAERLFKYMNTDRKEKNRKIMEEFVSLWDKDVVNQ